MSTAEAEIGDQRTHPRKIFVGGLSHRTTTGNLRDYFQYFGCVVDTIVMRWTDGRSRGFGYVTFSEAEPLNAVMAQRHEIGGRVVEVKRAVPGTNKVFVGGLPQNATSQDLRNHFESYGAVSDAVVMMDTYTNRSRGFGFVCFASGQEGADAVAMVLEQHNRHRLFGKWIEVKGAAPPHKLVAASASPSPSPSGSDKCSSEAVEHLSEEERSTAGSRARGGWPQTQPASLHPWAPPQHQRKGSKDSSAATTTASTSPVFLPCPTPPSSLGTPRKVALPELSSHCPLFACSSSTASGSACGSASGSASNLLAGSGESTSGSAGFVVPGPPVSCYEDEPLRLPEYPLDPYFVGASWESYSGKPYNALGSEGSGQPYNSVGSEGWSNDLAVAHLRARAHEHAAMAALASLAAEQAMNVGPTAHAAPWQQARSCW